MVGFLKQKITSTKFMTPAIFRNVISSIWFSVFGHKPVRVDGFRRGLFSINEALLETYVLRSTHKIYYVFLDKMLSIRDIPH